MGSLNIGAVIARRRREGDRLTGFTLVEILVVLVVLGIAAGLLVANLESDDRRAAEHEAVRLAGALEHAVAAAQWSGDTLGISADGRAYRFWRRDVTTQWQVIAGDDVLAPRALPTGMQVRPASYAGAAVPPDAILPFRPSGRNEPYSLSIFTRGWKATVAGDPLNRVAFSLQRVDGGS